MSTFTPWLHLNQLTLEDKHSQMKTKWADQEATYIK